MSAQKVNKPFLIGVAGGTAAGKSTVCDKIMAKLGQDCQQRVALIKQDSFYRQLTADELAQAKIGRFNFDHPDAVDDEAMYQALKDILAGVPVRLPKHDYLDNRPKSGEFTEIQSADVVLFEGMLIFYFPKVRDMFNMKLFVDTDSDTRLSRRVLRDVHERGRTLEVVLDQYDQFVKPAFEEFCQPTKKYADVIIPRGADNEVAIGLINHNVTYLLSSLRNRYVRSAALVTSCLAAAMVASSSSPSLPPKSSIAIRKSSAASQDDEPNSLSCASQMLTSPPPATSTSVRSRSNSYVSSTATLAANQRISAGIKEELDASSLA